MGTNQFDENSYEQTLIALFQDRRWAISMSLDMKWSATIVSHS